MKKPADAPTPRKPAAGRPASRPSLRVVYPAPLRSRALAVLDEVERGGEPPRSVDAFGDVAVELTETGMGYFFLKPLEEAKAGFVVRQGAELGLSGALRVMAPVIRTLLSRLDRPQLLVVARFVREILA